VSELEFNVPFQHKHRYIRDESRVIGHLVQRSDRRAPVRRHLTAPKRQCLRSPTCHERVGDEPDDQCVVTLHAGTLTASASTQSMKFCECVARFQPDRRHPRLRVRHFLPRPAWETSTVSAWRNNAGFATDGTQRNNPSVSVD